MFFNKHRCIYDGTITGSAGRETGGREVAKQHAERQEAAGQRVLTWTRNEKNKLQDANTQLGKELKDVRAQLADALKENRKLRDGIFSMLFNLLPHSSLMRILTSLLL